MGLSQSLWTGLSGLKTHQSWTNVIGNNLTNSNTDGFKYSQVNFSDLLYNSINPGSPDAGDVGSTNPNQVGNGVTLGSVDKVFTQGNLDLTERVFDCALEGTGFFVLGSLDGSIGTGTGGGGGGDGGTGSASNQAYYTRNGSFYLGAPSADGALTQHLLSSEGLSVYGFNATGGVIGGGLESIVLPSLGTMLNGLATTELDMSGNLNSGDAVVKGNSVQTTIPSTTGTGAQWYSDNGSAINIGGVETTPYLYDEGGTSATSAAGSTDLINLAYQRVSGPESLFGAVPAGFTADSREIEVEFTKGGLTYNSTFTYGVDGTTLEDFSEWLTGGFGDDGTPATQRIEGGAMGTVRTREYTQAADGFYAPSEQAGGYLRSDGTGTTYSIASNLGAQSTISDIRINTVMHLVNASTGEERNIQASFTDLFGEDQAYPADKNGGSASKGFEIFTADATATGGVTEEYRNMSFTLISRDSSGSTWRWSMDGAELEEDGLNQGTGIIRFGTDPNAESQVLAQTVDGGSTLTLDFGEMTQMGAVDNIDVVQNGYDYGELDGYAIDQYGTISGTYTNGLTEILAKIGTALVQNEGGLLSVGNTLFTASNVAGKILYNTPEDDLSLAVVRSNYLESSNVDMAREMSNLLLSQRGYQVSSKIITTSDEMLQTAYQLKG